MSLNSPFLLVSLIILLYPYICDFFFFLHLSGNFSLQIEVKFSQGTCVVTSGSCWGRAGRCCHMGTHLSLMLRVQSHPPEGA